MARVEKGDKQLWPSWRYGPDGQSAIFDAEGDVPSGWKDHPSAFAKQPDEAPAGRQPETAVDDDSFLQSMSEDELRKALDGKGIEYHPKAKKEKLISLFKTGQATKHSEN